MSQLTSIAAIGGFLFGYDTSSIAGSQLYFEDTWPAITTSEIALVVSLALIGAAVGSFFSGYVSDRVGRFVVGAGVGVAAQIIPLYLSEMAPTEIRGKMVATNNAMITVG